MKDKSQKILPRFILFCALCSLLFFAMLFHSIAALAQVGNSPVVDRLNEAWLAKDTADKVFDFRAAAQTMSNVIANQLAIMDAIAKDAAFKANVADEIKNEGAAILAIAIAANDALTSHSEFILWKQPQGN